MRILCNFGDSPGCGVQYTDVSGLEGTTRALNCYERRNAILSGDDRPVRYGSTDFCDYTRQ